MAERAEYGLTDSDLRILREVVARVRGGQFNLAGPGDFPRNRTILMRAKTDGSHAAGATQAVNLCDSSWAELSGATVDAENPSSGIDIPDNTRLLIAPGDGAALIFWADICEV